MSDDNKRASAIVREIERRVVWLGTFLVTKRGNLASAAAKHADEGLTEYERRFTAIPPDGLP